MEKDIAELVIAHTEDLKKLGVALIVLLTVNIIGLLGKFLVEDRLKNKEIKINKASIFNNRQINIQESLFHLLDALTLIDPTDSSTFLSKIQETDQYIRKNKLFLNKRVQRISITLLDYYKTILNNPGSKNFEYEFEQLEMFTDEFTKL